VLPSTTSVKVRKVTIKCYVIEPCPPRSAQGRLHAEVSLLEFCPVTFPRLSSRDWLPWEGERVGAVSESFFGATEARTLTLSYTCSSGEEAGQPRGTYLAELSTLPTGPTIEYDRKLKIQFWFGVFQNGI